MLHWAVTHIKQTIYLELIVCICPTILGEVIAEMIDLMPLLLTHLVLKPEYSWRNFIYIVAADTLAPFITRSSAATNMDNAAEEDTCHTWGRVLATHTTSVS